MKFATFIVVDEKLSRNKEIFDYTVNGDVIYPLETPLPVIRKGSGCIGVGIITTSTRKKSSTTITFRISQVSPEDGKAYYNLYRNQISVSENPDDAYDTAADMVIPGMMTSADIRPDLSSSKNRSYSQNRRSRNQSLSDILDDDFDDDYHWE